MTRKTIAPLAVVLVLMTAGCADRREAAPPANATTTSGPAGTSTTTTTSARVDATSQACEFLDTAAMSQSFNAAIAIAEQEGPAMRASVAATYSTFADTVAMISQSAAGDLRPVLTEWASASREVAQFVLGHEPSPGMVLELGPAHPRWLAAEKSAEDICGHPLPDTGDTP